MLITAEEQKTTDGTAYIEAGSGVPLILIHGVGLNKQVWQPQWQDFSRSCHVIAYDTLGHGNSRVPDESVCLDDYLEQLLSLIDALGFARVALCGHSMGALITLGFALKYPDRVSAIVPLMAAFNRSEEHQQRSRRVADMLAGDEAESLLEGTLQRWFTDEDYADDTRREKIKMVENWLLSADRDGYSRAYRMFAQNGETYVGRLGNINVPALVITAEFDPNSTPAMSKQIADEIPQSELVIMSGERHMGQYLGSNVLNPAVTAFLDRLKFQETMK